MVKHHLLRTRAVCAYAVLIGLFLISSAALAETTWHVDDDNCPGPGRGTKKDPFCSIQDAIDAALGGDEILVAPGTYFETIDFFGKAITVRSSDGPAVTIIDAQQTGTVVTCNSGEGPDTVLDGLTVTGGEPSGMRNLGSSPTVTNCTFSGNSAFGGGGDGGGMFNINNSSPTVTNCTFSGNSADDRGGGMSNGNNSSPTVTNCTFSGNMVSGPFGGGGGMFNGNNSNPTVTNCTFTGNAAGFTDGGGMASVGSSPTVTNCTFSDNSAGDGGGMFNLGDSNPTVTNCIVWGDVPNEIFGPATVRYSNIDGGFAGVGNIDANPLFVDPDNGDYRLSAGSPCIDAANNWGVPLDDLDYDEDGITNELFPVDVDGNPRFNADENDFDPGCGVPVVVDMGAYEYQFDPVENVIFADLNGDGSVGAADLLGLLISWGPCAKGCCLADLDLDGAVGASDLLIPLANWG